MRIAMAILIATCAALISAAPASADSYCSETITQIIIKNDAVYFTTNKSCPNWCELNPSWDATTINRALSVMIAAKTSGSSVTFEWPDQSGPCSNVEQTYSAPGAVIM